MELSMWVDSTLLTRVHRYIIIGFLIFIQLFWWYAAVHAAVVDIRLGDKLGT